MLLYVLECTVYALIILLGITQIILPLFQGKEMFPMLHKKDDTFEGRLKNLEEEIRRGQEIERRVQNLFESQPTETETSNQRKKERI